MSFMFVAVFGELGSISSFFFLGITYLFILYHIFFPLLHYYHIWDYSVLFENHSSTKGTGLLPFRKNQRLGYSTLMNWIFSSILMHFITITLVLLYDMCPSTYYFLWANSRILYGFTYELGSLLLTRLIFIFSKASLHLKPPALGLYKMVTLFSCLSEEI